VVNRLPSRARVRVITRARRRVLYVSTFSHTDHLHLIVSIHTGSMLPKEAWSRKKRRKLAAKRFTNSPDADKIAYPTLGKALDARSHIVRKRGDRFRRLRPYRHRGSWFLTKMTKGQFQGATRRGGPPSRARTRDHARAGAS